MIYVICALAVYKLVQLLDALTPREAMPWVKVLAGTVFGYLVALPAGVPHGWTSGLVVATLAGACHAVLRFITLLGDMVGKRTIR